MIGLLAHKLTTFTIVPDYSHNFHMMWA